MGLNPRPKDMTKKQIELSIEQATTLLDAMDEVSKPFTNWEDHDALRGRLRDLIIWMEAE